jgi:hypothetical protein
LFIAAFQFNEELTFTDIDSVLCLPLIPSDDSVVGNDVALVLELDSTDRAVSDLGTANLIIRDDDSKQVFFETTASLM